MALTVGVDTYIDVDDCAAYAASRGLSFPVLPLDAAESALRRATTWIDGQFGSRFSGVKSAGRAQQLAWPRRGATDADGFEIADDEIPDEIIRACAESAIRELAEAGSLSPDVRPNEIIASAAVSGAVSVTYASSEGIDGQRPIATVIDDILAGLIGKRAKPGAAVIGRMDRGA